MVEEGETEAEPDVLGVTYPTLLMYIVVAFCEVQLKVEELPYATGFGERETEQVGGEAGVYVMTMIPCIPPPPGPLPSTS